MRMWNTCHRTAKSVSPRNASRLKSGPKKVLPISLADFGAAEIGSESGSSSESEN
jgi:hypothetical protein